MGQNSLLFLSFRPPVRPSLSLPFPHTPRTSPGHPRASGACFPLPNPPNPQIPLIRDFVLVQRQTTKSRGGVRGGSAPQGGVRRHDRFSQAAEFLPPVWDTRVHVVRSIYSDLK